MGFKLEMRAGRDSGRIFKSRAGPAAVPGLAQQFLNLLAFLAGIFDHMQKFIGISALYRQILCTESQKLRVLQSEYFNSVLCR